MFDLKYKHSFAYVPLVVRERCRECVVCVTRVKEKYIDWKLPRSLIFKQKVMRIYFEKSHFTVLF